MLILPLDDLVLSISEATYVEHAPRGFGLCITVVYISYFACTINFLFSLTVFTYGLLCWGRSANPS